MDRRTLLKLLAASSLIAANPLSKNNKLKVIVVGAGIIGASIAYHLAKSGVQVTVIDQEAPASHASRGTFAWINATWPKQPHAYHTLNQESVANWYDLQKSLNLSIKWRGSIEWFESAERQLKLVDQIEEQKKWGEPAEMIGPKELEVLEPQMDFSSTKLAAFSPRDGAIDPVAATNALLKAAIDLGAEVKYPCRLTDVLMKGGRLQSIKTTLSIIEADKLVIATGASPNAGQEFAGINIPQRTTPGIITITKPFSPILNRVISAPGIHMHQRSNGRIVIGEQEGPPKNTVHKIRLKGRPNQYPNEYIAHEHAARMIANAGTFLPAISGVEVDDVYIGWRPLPLDGQPVIGAAPERPDVYMAIMHSGVTLAPIVGQLATYELISGDKIEKLNAYRPDRAFKNGNRY
ncbi:MAG: NAD(P)/FAD-dependent oxidoreductase [Sphingomonadales bacterium]